MATYTQVPGLLNIKGVVGADFSCNLDFNISLAGYTFDAGIVLQEYPTKRIQQITVTVNDAPNGLISLTLTDAETTAIGPISNKKWYLDWTSGVTKNTIISGKFELSDIPIGQAVETNNDVIVETPEVTVTLTSLTGSAININATNDTTTNASFYPVFVAAAGSGQTAKVSTSKLSFNPSSGNLSATAFTGDLTGNVAGTASNATTSAAVATTATTTNATYYIPFVSNATSQSAETVRVSSSPTFNPSTNTLSSPVFSGTLTGTASSANSALTATINNDNSTNREFFPVFAYQSAGTATTLYGSSAKLKFNPSNGYFTAEGLVADSGNLELRNGGVHWNGQSIFDAQGQGIYNSDGEDLALWGAGGMRVVGTASKDVPLRLMGTNAEDLSTGSYIIVRPSASATTNGTELRNAYAAAKAFTPNSLALSATNRATVLLLPGRYDLGTTPLAMDTEFVDLVGLSEEPKHVFITSQVIVSDSGTIVQTADNVVIRNVSIDRTGNPAGSGAGRTAAYFPNRNSTSISSWSSDGTTATITSNGHGLQQGDSVRITSSGNTSFNGSYIVASVIDANSFTFASTVNSSGAIGTATERFDDTYIENCRFSGTSNSGMRGAIEYAGTYRRCIGGVESFGGAFGGSGVLSAIASGLFEDCVGGVGSFGRGTASGTFNRCTAGGSSFGGTASGTFTDCSASGGGFSVASGTFLRCSANGGFGSGGGGVASGTLTDCSVSLPSAYLGTFTGTMRGCRFSSPFGSALRVGSGAKIFDSTLIAPLGSNSITAGSAVTISLAGCRMNRDINANVSNNLGTLTESYNLIDADID